MKAPGRGQLGRAGHPLGEAEVGEVDALAPAPTSSIRTLPGFTSRWTRPALVRGVERGGDLGDDPRGARGLEPPLGRDQRPQVGALDEVHRHEQDAVLLAGVADLDDVGVADRDGGPRLAHEALAEPGVVGELRRDHLQRDDVVERQVGRPVDDSHPSPTGDPVDAMAGEDGAFGQLRHAAIYRPASRRERETAASWAAARCRGFRAALLGVAARRAGSPPRRPSGSSRSSETRAFSSCITSSVRFSWTFSMVAPKSSPASSTAVLRRRDDHVARGQQLLVVLEDRVRRPDRRTAGRRS